MSVMLKCFKSIEDAEPEKVYEGDSFQAYAETPKHTRIVINPQHADPKKSLQVDVREGERNSTDPLRYERAEVYEFDAADEGATMALTFYADKDGNQKPLKSDEEELADERNLEALIADHASAEELTALIGMLDYKSLEDELKHLGVEVPQRKVDRVRALISASVEAARE